MRPLGITALILTVLSFLFWLVTWVYWTFFTLPLSQGLVLNYVVRGLGFLGYVFQTLALVLVCIGLMMAAKRLPKN